MKKFNRREKLYIRLMILTVAVALLLDGHKRYTEYKLNLQADIESTQSQIGDLLDRLEGEDADEYAAKSQRLEADLSKVRESILRLPTEAEASLVIRETVSAKAEEAGVTVNSISQRKTVLVNESESLTKVPVYFVYDSDLEPLLKFFEQVNNQNYFLTIETLSIQVRRSFSRRRKNVKKNPRRRQLTGNATLAALFQPEAEGSVDAYSAGEKASAANKDQPGATMPADGKSAGKKTSKKSSGNTAEKASLNNEVAANEEIQGDVVPSLMGVAGATRGQIDETNPARSIVKTNEPKTSAKKGKKPAWQPKPKRLSGPSSLKKTKKPDFSP